MTDINELQQRLTALRVTMAQLTAEATTLKSQIATAKQRDVEARQADVEARKAAADQRRQARLAARAADAQARQAAQATKAAQDAARAKATRLEQDRCRLEGPGPWAIRREGERGMPIYLCDDAQWRSEQDARIAGVTIRTGRQRRRMRDWAESYGKHVALQTLNPNA